MRPTELAATAPRAETAALGWIALMIIVAGLNLRPLLTTLGASLDEVQLDLGMSASAAGALASIPTLCMGTVSLLGGLVIGRMGIGRGMQAALLLVAVGSAARWAGAEARWLLYLATFVGGLGIACGQVLIPVVVKQFFPGRAALLMGGYTMAMNLGAALGAAATPALIQALGGWAPAFAAWALPALLAAALWPARLQRRITAESLALPWRSGVGWLLAAFLGTGSLCYMALMAWLVPLYSALGWPRAEGAALLTVFTGAQIVAALLLPLAVGRRRDRRPALVILLAMLAAGLAGFWLSPGHGASLWSILAGVGLGGSFPLALTLPLDYTDTPAEAGRLSAMVLGLGMLMGAAGPSLFGLLRDAFGFGAALSFLTGSAAVSSLLGFSFRPPRLKEDIP